MCRHIPKSSSPRIRGEADLNAPVVLIFNPVAGRGDAVRRRTAVERLLRARGIEFDIRESHSLEAAADVAEATAREGASVVVACGGDGTVNRVATGLLRARERDATNRAALAVVPLGTGNDFAKLLGIGGSIERAVEVIASGPVHEFDSGIAEWEGGEARFVNAFGTGIDVEVVRQIHRLSLPPALTYFVGLARALMRYRPIPIRLRTAESGIDASIMMVAVSNGRCVGGSFNICPAAEPDDGLFDVCVIRAVSLAATPALALRIVRGSHAGHPAVAFFRSTDVQIEVGGHHPLFFQVDGELFEPAGASAVRVRILPSSLPVRVASRNRDATSE